MFIQWYIGYRWTWEYGVVVGGGMISSRCVYSLQSGAAMHSCNGAAMTHHGNCCLMESCNGILWNLHSPMVWHWLPLHWMHSTIVWHWLPRHWLPLSMPAFSSVSRDARIFQPRSRCPRFPVTRRVAPPLLYSRRRQFVHIYLRRYSDATTLRSWYSEFISDPF